MVVVLGRREETATAGQYLSRTVFSLATVAPGTASSLITRSTAAAIVTLGRREDTSTIAECKGGSIEEYGVNLEMQ